MNIEQITICLLAFLALSLIGFKAYAEGSFQVGLNQPLLEESHNKGFPQFVDVVTIGEVINISLCGDSDSDNLDIDVYNPDGVQVVNRTLFSSNVSCSSNFDAPLTNPVRYTSITTGTYKIHLNNNNGDTLERFDISITPDVATDPDPGIAAGRLWALEWGFNAGSYAEGEATDADYYPLVLGGRANTNYVWKLDLNKFAGFEYVLAANDLGVDAPYSGFSVLTSGNTITPKFPIYLGYPAVADPRPTDPPVISTFRFIDNEDQDYGISPNTTAGTQDSGSFEFTSDVDGTYSIIVDTNLDGVYGAGDKLILGVASTGAHSVVWDGTDATGAVLPNGTYRAQLQLRLGEYHFIADDAETSGGGTNDGLTIYLANDDGSTTDVQVYWDDETFRGATTTLPNGELSSSPAGKHTWGDFSGDSIGNNTYIDTYVFGLASTATALTAITNDDDALTGVNGIIAASPTEMLPGALLNVTVTDADLNILAAVQESTYITVSNDRTGEIEQIDLTESGINSALFLGYLSTVDNASAGTNNDGSINVQLTDVLTITYADELDSAGESVTRTTQVSFPDTDGDGIADSLDLDDDNDGLPDTDEGNGTIDSDSDGIADSLDLDSDNDGLFDLAESGADAAALDSDDNGQIDAGNSVGSNGLADAVETVADNGTLSYALRDSDSDGVHDFRDLDSDNDGIPDVIESGGSDVDGDGILGTGAPTIDGSGVPTGGGLSPLDTDGDGIANQLDLDSDGDGLFDLVEADGPDSDDNGLVDSFTDGNGDGFDDSLDGSMGGTPLTLTDTDSDGVEDYIDLDSDNDGISDVLESGGSDPDGDGVVGTGIPTVDANGVALSGALTPIDTDEDGVDDFRDLDSDNDGLPDVIEVGGSDPDDDGVIGSGLPTVNGDGMPSGGGLLPADADADGITDQLDLDSDGDGQYDLAEAGGTDSDNDGLADGFTDLDGNGFDDGITGSGLSILDSDGDGIPDYRDIDDLDNDGVVDSMDLDSDNDGIPDSFEGDGAVDTDADGIPDNRDLDSDNDGLFDLRESGANATVLDADNNGRIDTANGVGTNGLADAVETSPDVGAINYNGGLPQDSDSDSVYNFRDLDSDNDGVYDVIETGGSDPDGDGISGSGVPAVNPDGIAAGSGLAVPDTDADGVANHLDLDSDNDGIPDVTEAGGSDPDADGIVGSGVAIVNATGTVTSGGGLNPPDTDTDGIVDMLDFDADGDGTSDLIEAGGVDTDGDGRVDSFTDANGDGQDDTIEAKPLPMTDSDGDGLPDYLEAAQVDGPLLTGLEGIGGCTLGSGDQKDPTLPLLVLISMLYLLNQKIRTKYAGKKKS